MLRMKLDDLFYPTLIDYGRNLMEHVFWSNVIQLLYFPENLEESMETLY